MGNQQTACILTENELRILLRTSNKSENELRQWYNEFMKDSDNTGRMNKRQFRVFYTKLKQNPNLDKLTDHIFRAFDTDHSGTISFKEFLAACIITTDGTQHQKFEYTFDVFDINEDQFIEKKEAKKILNIICRILNLSEDDAKTYARTLMITYDTNSDKVLSRKEFIDGCLHDTSLRYILDSFYI